MVSEKKIFLSFHYKTMAANDSLRRGQFGPQGFDWQDLCRPLLHNLLTLGLMVSEKKVFEVL